MDIMSRSDGKIYHGMIHKTGEGQGTATMNIAGVEYTGRFARTSSEQYTSFVGTYARNNQGGAAGAVGSGTTFGSNMTFLGILSSPQGDGMRCALQGDRMSGTGGGICVDSKNNVFDVIYHWSGGLF